MLPLTWRLPRLGAHSGRLQPPAARRATLHAAGAASDLRPTPASPVGFRARGHLTACSRTVTRPRAAVACRRWAVSGVEARFPQQPRQTPMSTPPATILIVDDEELNRDGLARRLQRHDYEVVAAPERPGGDRAARRAAVRPRPARHHDARDERAGGAQVPPPGRFPDRPADHHGHRQGGERGHGRGPRTRGQRLRHQAARLPGRAGPHPDPVGPPPGGRPGEGAGREAGRPQPGTPGGGRRT